MTSVYSHSGTDASIKPDDCCSERTRAPNPRFFYRLRTILGLNIHTYILRIIYIYININIYVFYIGIILLYVFVARTIAGVYFTWKDEYKLEQIHNTGKREGAVRNYTGVCRPRIQHTLYYAVKYIRMAITLLQPLPSSPPPTADTPSVYPATE